MFEIITKDLILREFKTSDAKDLYELNSDPIVIKYTGDKAFESINEAKKFIQAYDQYEKYKMGRWAVVSKNTQEFIGWCGLKFNKKREIDLGFRLFRVHWGKGYATQASMACLGYGFNSLNLEKIIGRTSVSNIAAQKVLENCGFQKIGSFEYKGIGPSYYYELLKLNYQS